ncbi:hypothetical protein BDQ17DRAFT_572887 [Cyathus striatus]|nr:hypothetical protein BDQ17DRAFT_572887 [Cyathus striatus]
MKHKRLVAKLSSSKSNSTRAGKNHSNSSTRSLVESIRNREIESADYDTMQSAAAEKMKRSPYWRPTKAHRLASEFFEDSAPTAFTDYRDQRSSTRLGSVIPSLPLGLLSSRSTAAEPARRVVIKVDPEINEEDESFDTADEDEDEDEDEEEPEDTIGDCLSSIMMATLRARSLEEQTDDFLDTVPIPIATQTAQVSTLFSVPSQPSALSQPSAPNQPIPSQLVPNQLVPSQLVPSQLILSQPSIPSQPDDDDDDDEFFDAIADEGQLAAPEANDVSTSISSNTGQLAEPSQQPNERKDDTSTEFVGVGLVSASAGLSAPQVEPSLGLPLSGEDSDLVANCLPPAPIWFHWFTLLLVPILQSIYFLLLA